MDTYFAKQMFTCWVSLFCNGFTLGPTAQATPVYVMMAFRSQIMVVLVCWRKYDAITIIFPTNLLRTRFHKITYKNWKA